MKSSRRAGLMRGLGRALLGGLLGWAALGGLLALLSVCGIRFQGPSGHGQLAVLLGLGFALGAALALPPRVRRLASLSLYAGRLRRWPSPSALLTGLAALCLILLWLGAAATQSPGRPIPALVWWRQPRFAPPDGSKLTLRVQRPGSADAANPGSGWERWPEGERGLSGNVRAFRPARDGPALDWLALGAGRWPIPRPAQAVPILPAEGLDGKRLGERVGPFRFESGGPAFPLGDLVSPRAPGPAWPRFRVEQFGAAGFKPVAVSPGSSLRLFQWAALPSPPLQPATAPSGVWLWPVLVDTDSDGAGGDPENLFPQKPVLSVAYRDGLPRFALTPTAGGLDVLGESGLAQGTTQLNAALRRWQALHQAAPAGFLATAHIAPRRPSAAIDLFADRYLPAPTAPPEAARRTPDSFPVNPWLGGACLALLSLLGLAWCWPRR